MEAWIDVHGTTEQRKVLMESLPSLTYRRCWFWSPVAGRKGIFQRTHIQPIRTFDSGATPEPGKKRIAPKNLADVDLDALKRQMALTIERAKADNPSELRRQIADLKAQLAKNAIAQPRAESVNKEAIDKRIAAAVKKRSCEQKPACSKCSARHSTTSQNCSNAPPPLWRRCEYSKQPPAKRLESSTNSSDERDRYIAKAAVASASSMRISVAHAPARPPSGPTRQIRQATPIFQEPNATSFVLVQFDECRKKSKLARIAGYAVDGGGFNNALSNLRTLQLIEGSNILRITQAGIEAAGPVAPLPTGRELLAHWMSHKSIGKAERVILKTLSEEGPELSKLDLAQFAGYSADGGGFNNALSTLRTLGLISGKTAITIMEELL